MTRDDISSSPQIHFVKDEIEKIHYEDTYQTHRLNKDVDINHIDVHQLMAILNHNEKHYTPITKATIRTMQQQTLNIRMQLDSGANRTVTPHRHLLHNITNIPPMSIDGVGGTIAASEVGYLKLRCVDDTYIWARTYFCPDVTETIVSPTDITLSHKNNFTAWSQFSDVITGTGNLTFYTKSGLGQAKLSLFMTNGLWYSTQHVNNIQPTPSTTIFPTIRNISAKAEYELWHQRLGHAGEKVLQNIHKCVDGIPNLHAHKHNFHKCECCMRGKVKSARKNKSTHIVTTARGQMYHMDFGFVRGSAYKSINDKGKIVTSRDGYNSYLIIVDSYTRYTWVYLSASKQPPLAIVQQFLDRYGIKEGSFRQVRCDQGGELAKSSKFREIVQQSGYSVEPTSSDNSSQNGIAERPNRTFGDMMRSMLINAGLPAQYWSYALIQSVFIKNRLPHAHHEYNKTPFEAITGRRPNVRDIKIFGSRVVAKKTGHRSAKLDDHTSRGIFLHHTATTSISKYLDNTTKREKITSHLEYDEAHYTIRDQDRPIGAKALLNHGYNNNAYAPTINPPKPVSSNTTPTKLYIQKLSENATLPIKSTDGAAGLDLYSAEPCIILPNEIKLIKTDIALICPPGTYGRIAPRSGLTIKQQLDVRAGVIDSDYRGNIIVAMHNIGAEERNLEQGTKIAQLILEKISNVVIEEVNELPATERGTNGFGSTDNNHKHLHVSSTSTSSTIETPLPSPTTVLQPTKSPLPSTDTNQAAPYSANADVIPYEDNELNTPTINAVTSDLEDIYLSYDPFGPTTTATIRVSGVHPTLGLELDFTDTSHRLILRNCAKSTPAHKIKRWRSTLRNGSLIRIDNKPTPTINDVEAIIEQARLEQKSHLTLTFATDEKVPVHVESGVPQLHFDQLNALAAYLQEIKLDETFLDNDLETPLLNLLKVKKSKGMAQFTRKQLKQRDDWKDWEKSEHKQLDLYQMQDMFGRPMRPPPGANILSLLWTYGIKADGTKKARCVCNGNPRRKGTVTLAHTFAACLEQPGARSFWSSAAYFNMLVLGADASNAFAEAPAPTAPLYVIVDTQFREWWRQQGHINDIPAGSVLPVNHALQGHPESPRLWAEMIDEIIQDKVGLTPCTHEPCLYSGYVDGKKVLFLRQVDDFAVACTDTNVSNKVIDLISAQLSAPMHKLGIINRYNGVDIRQTHDYIKIHTKTYLTKILTNHGWLNDTYKSHVNPIPMKEDAAYQTILDRAEGPINETEKADLQQEMGFDYRNALGEALFAMITCRPDISFPIIKLSKFANNPAREHYQALKNVFRYLRETIDLGLIYWRRTTQEDIMLQPSEIPTTFHQKCEQPNNKSTKLQGSVDSDWATDAETRKSISGIVFYFAGAAIHYKTKFQNIVSHSSTEAEFIAACDAAKVALYLRSIFEDIGIPQEEATVILEDNTGALMMANAKQPTRRTKHMEVKHFAIQNWVEEDLILLEQIPTTNNSADSFTKALPRTLFYKHSDVIMGRIPPPYYKGDLYNTFQTQKQDYPMHTTIIINMLRSKHEELA